MKVYGRGDADLERRIEKLQEQVEGYKALIELYKKQLWELGWYRQKMKKILISCKVTKK